MQIACSSSSTVGTVRTRSCTRSTSWSGRARSRLLAVRAGISANELLPFDPEEDEMVRAEIGELAAWLGVELQAW